ncbi:hypothetical protein LINGRAHAP2_LOCUS34808 [Linum grandiflorum]
MAAMTKNVFVLAVMLLLLFAATPTGVSSAPVNSPAKIVNGIFSNTLSAIMKWIWSLKASSKTAMTGRPLMKFEPGYTVETMFDGSKAGIDPHSVEVLPSGELLILDSANNNLYKIPSSLSMWVTTIAGGKRTNGGGGGGHVDGASEDAKFSNDFDVVYMGSSCSLLVIDRGNRAIREIQLHFDDCAYQYGSGFPFGKTKLSMPYHNNRVEIALLLAAGLFGYMIAFLQRRMGAIASSHQHQRHTAAGWPSQESYVIRDEDEPPTVEARTPTPRRKTYAFMSKDAEKMQRWRQGRSFYSGQQSQSQKQSKHHLRRYQSSVSAVPHTYYEQSHEETNEIVFGAVQEHDVKACAPVVKPMDYGDPMYNNHHHGGIRVRSSSSAAYGNGFC